MSVVPTAEPLRFGRFELQPHQRRLLVDGQPASVGARALDMLILLARRNGELVSKRELMDEVWPGLVVEENNLAVHISALRKLLGNATIATVPGWGYRFTATVERAQALPPDVAPSPAPMPATRTLRTNLPAELPPLFGRERDLQALGVMVDSAPLVTVVGAGGIGKTVLARQVLQARRTAYPQGVCWVELGAVTDAAQLPGAVMAALGVEGGAGDPEAALLAAVAPLKMLLALDNAEQLAGDIAQLCQRLVDAAPGLHLLVTSQAPLKLATEHVYRLDTLAVPAVPMPAAEALAFGAVALFVERARAADARFMLDDAQVGKVVELCAALDGLPLALELAAARAPMLGLQRLAASMDERLKLLTRSRDRAAPARQQTLRAALEWSHGFLDEREQSVFRRLGVVAGSASLDLVQQLVSDDTGVDEWEALDALGVLVDRSLVAVVGADPQAEPRYRMLESQRAFALERLQLAGELACTQQRHAQAVARQFEGRWVDRDNGKLSFADWQAHLAPDLDNAREAIAWAQQAGDAACALAIGATLLRAMPHALQAERLALAEQFERLLHPDLAPRLRLRTWLMLADVWADTQWGRSRAATQQAVHLAAELDGQERPRHRRYPALYDCCRWAAKIGHAVMAEQAAADLRSPLDAVWTPQRRFYLAEAEAVLSELRGDRPEMLRHFRRAVASGSDRQGTAQPADAALDEALPRARARLNLFGACLALNDPQRAAPLAAEGWAEARRFGLQRGWLAHLALWAVQAGRHADGACLLGRAQAAPATADDHGLDEIALLELAREAVAGALGAARLRQHLAAGAALDDDGVAALLNG